MTVAVFHIKGMFCYERMNKRTFSFVAGKKDLEDLEYWKKVLFPDCHFLKQPALRRTVVASSSETGTPR